MTSMQFMRQSASATYCAADATHAAEAGADSSLDFL